MNLLENSPKAAQLDRDINHRDHHHQPDTHILDYSNHSGCTNTTYISVGCKKDKSDYQRDFDRNTHLRNDNLHAIHLESNIRHNRQNASNSHKQGQGRAIKTLAHKIGRSHIPTMSGNSPKFGHYKKKEYISESSVGNSVETQCTNRKDKARQGDKRIRRINIPTQQTPCNNRPKTSPRKPPFLQAIQITLTPASRPECNNSHTHEHYNKDTKHLPVHH